MVGLSVVLAMGLSAGVASPVGTLGVEPIVGGVLVRVAIGWVSCLGCPGVVFRFCVVGSMVDVLGSVVVAGGLVS